MKRKISVSLLFCALAIPLFSQNKYEPVLGIWEGKLGVSKTDTLTFVMVVEKKGDSVSVELDSPDQYAIGMAATAFSFVKDTVTFRGPSAISYKGALDREKKKITGLFRQGNAKFELDLYPVEKRTVFLRPQEPKLPFPYKEEEITIRNDKAGYTITGTLTYPQSDKPLPLLILISGSGWQDRNSTIFAHKPFWVIADYLSRSGYAVFRYDDRPGGIFRKSTTFDFASDVNVMVDSLRSDPRIDREKIGLIGHSEGSLVAFIAAADNPKIRNVISMAGPAETIDGTLLYQAEALALAENVPEETIRQSLALNKELYEMMKKAKTPEIAGQNFKKIIDRKTENMSDEERKLHHLTSLDILAMSQQLLSPWFFTMFKIDPKIYIQKIKCPVYAINGENDLQVSFATNLPLIRKYLKRSPHSLTESFPRLNHLFQESTTGSSSEYGKIEQTFSPLVLEKILDWLNNTLK